MAKKTILIIEDDKLLREVITKKLTIEDFEVQEAVDGGSGLRALKEKRPDLILLDLVLPGMDGFEFLSKIKADSHLASIPVVIISNLSQKEDVKRGLKLGAIDYLIKAHFNPSQIVEKIKDILKK